MSNNTQILNSITPLIPSGGPPVSISVDQTFGIPIALTGAKAVSVQVNGPQTTLSESDIDSVYPAPGSTDSPDEFLPHIAIQRRTLPWERTGPAPGQPWLAVLLLKSSELQGDSGIHLIPGKTVDLGDLLQAAHASVLQDAEQAHPLLPAEQLASQVVRVSNKSAVGVASNVAASTTIDKAFLSPSVFGTQFFPPLTPTKPAVVSGKTLDVKARDAAGYQQMKASGLNDADPLSLLFLRNSVFGAICPRSDEFEFLCHVRRTQNETGTQDRAVVVGCRLPDASSTSVELHTAFLVSLEKRSDAFAPDRAAKPNGEIGLVVLHAWNFTPSKGGDFEEVMKSIPIRPNGGVLRFGNLPENVAPGETAPLSAGFGSVLDTHGNFIDPLPHTQPGNATYRGPLLPYSAPARSAGFAVRSAPEEFEDESGNSALPKDYSYAAAFELGRLLAIGNQDVLEDLRDVHAVPPKPTEREFIQINLLPLALQKKDWVTNPGLEEANPWDMVANNAAVQIVKDPDQFASLGIADISGVAQQASQFNAVQTQLSTLGTAAVQQVSQIDITTISSIDLEKTFANVLAKAQP